MGSDLSMMMAAGILTAVTDAMADGCKIDTSRPVIATLAGDVYEFFLPEGFRRVSGPDQIEWLRIGPDVPMKLPPQEQHHRFGAVAHAAAPRRRHRPAEPQGDVLRPRQVAKLLGVAEDKVYTWIRNSTLAAMDLNTRPGGRPRYGVRRTDMEQFMESRRLHAAPPHKSRRHDRPPDYQEYV